MKAVLYIASMTIFFAGVMFFAASKSAIHETESFVLFLISAVLFSGAAIVGAIEKSSYAVETTVKSNARVATSDHVQKCWQCSQMTSSKYEKCAHCEAVINPGGKA